MTFWALCRANVNINGSLQRLCSVGFETQHVTIVRAIRNNNSCSQHKLAASHSMHRGISTDRRRICIAGPITTKNIVPRIISANMCTDKEFLCWKCGRKIAFQTSQYFCSCGIIQPPAQDRTYFEVMGLPVNFNLDTPALTVHFRQLQSVLHPDKFARKSDEEKGHSQMQSSLVNSAYKTLLKPLPRGLYMLNLHKEELQEGDIQMSSAFLMNIMEINEELDSISTIQELSGFDKENNKMVDILIKEIEEAFNKKEILLAKSKLAELQYYCNIDEKIKEKKLNFNDS